MSDLNMEQVTRSIYLGDRGIEGVGIDCLAREVRVIVDCISVFTGDRWQPGVYPEYEHAKLLFRGVDSIGFDPPGHLPNDYISGLVCHPIDDLTWQFVITCDSVGPSGAAREVSIIVVAESLEVEI